MNDREDSLRWQYLDTGFRPGAFNMECDVLLARRLSLGEGRPTLRVYGWKPYAVSLGYNQRRHDLDEECCAAQGVDIVRRPTGGRAVLHAEELTYSVVMVAGEESVTELYGSISRALVRGLHFVGADVDLAPAQPNFSRLYRDQTSIPCFASSARYEIQYRGRKLVGSAQRRYAGLNGEEIVLQHGSILLGPAHKRLSDLVRVESGDVHAAVGRDLEEKTIDLRTIVGHPVTFEDVADAIKRGFEAAWNIAFTDIEVEELLPAVGSQAPSQLVSL